MIKVSVIVPVYNVEKYLRHMLDSVCAQTLRDIEIICVDDGSTDASLQILKEYEKKDSRISVLKQENAGAGIARNTGMRAARGKYLSILDSDDFFEKDMLEKAYKKCEQDKAQICVFRSDRYDTKRRRYEKIPWTIQEQFLPKNMPFAPQDIYPYLFQIFNGWSWDKLYLRDAVIESGLQFQGLRTTNDAFFVFLMNLQADRITVIDEILAHHRVNIPTSLSVTREKSWDCCWQAAWAVRQELQKRDQYADVEQSYINWVLHFLLWNLHSMQKAQAKKNLMREMKEQYFPLLGFEQYPLDYFYNPNEYLEYQNICQPDGWKKRWKQIWFKIKRKLISANAKVFRIH